MGWRSTSQTFRRQDDQEDHAFATGWVGVVWGPWDVSPGLCVAGLFGGRVRGRPVRPLCARIAIGFTGSVYLVGNEVA